MHFFCEMYKDEGEKAEFAVFYVVYRPKSTVRFSIFVFELYTRYTLRISKERRPATLVCVCQILPGLEGARHGDQSDATILFAEVQSICRVTSFLIHGHIRTVDVSRRLSFVEKGQLTLFRTAKTINEKAIVVRRYSFRPVILTPSMKVRWAKKNATMMGTVKITEAAISKFHATLCRPWNACSPSAMVYSLGSVR